MPANVTLSLGRLYGFLLVLARISGALVFVPLPGMKSVADPARAAFALGFTLALMPRWPIIVASHGHNATGGVGRWPKPRWECRSESRWRSCWKPSPWRRRFWDCRPDTPMRTTIDPNTEADSGILLVFAQLSRGCCFSPWASTARSCACSPRAWTRFRRERTVSDRRPGMA